MINPFVEVIMNYNPIIVAKLNDISYSKLIYGLNLAGIDIDRKTLSDLALNEPDAFREIVSLAKDSLR